MGDEHKSREELIIELKKLQQKYDFLLETYNTDITERQQIEEKLRYNEQRLLLILNVTQIGIWDWDLENDIWYASPIYYTMLGYEPETGPSDRTVWLSRIHPEDREMVRDKINDVLIHKGDNYTYEARILHADGSYRWHQVIGCAVAKDDYRQVTRLVGIRKDITDYKTSEESLKTSQGRLHTLLDTIPDLIWLKNSEGVYLQCNQRFENLFGAPENEIVGKTDYDFVSKELADFFRQKDFEAKVAGKPSVNEEEVTFADGHKEILETIKTPLYEKDRKFIGILGIGRNITQRKQDKERILRLNRIYAVLSNINQIIVRTRDSQQLLVEACRIAVEDGKFKMAWIGMVNFKTNYVDVVASNGALGDYLEKININLNDEFQSKGPAGTTVKTGQYKISNNIATDDNMLPWRDNALKHGYRSVASFPLKVFDSIVGVFLIYADETDFFDEDDIKLLDEMAKDISFALEYIETETKHKLAQEKSLAYLRFLEEMDQVNRAILGTNDIEKMLSDVLNVVLSIFDCDRVWLFYPCDPKATSFRVPMEVTKPEYPGAGILNTDIPMSPDMAEDLQEALNAKEPVIYIAGTEKPINEITAEQFCVQSQIFYPLYPKVGKPWVFGMHQCSYPRTWTPDEKRLFQEISRRLSDALTSLLMFRDLAKKNNEYYALNEEYVAINKKLSQTNEDLLIAKERAEESDKLKTAFLHNMSHEIRTPMNAIMGFSELLVNNYNNKPKLEKFSEIIRQRCNDLLNLINDILDIAKIESGQLPVTMEECNLHDLFAELTSFFNEYQIRMGKQHIKFSLQAHNIPSGCVIVTDIVKLKQIFINLIGNAFKFTDKGIIEGGCRINDNDVLVFYVSDTGIGIPPDKQKLVFERFTQLNQKTNQTIGGTGLGLSIVKGLVSFLGGELWFESEPNKGSTFSFTISYKTTEQLRQELIHAEEPEKYDFSGKTILVVEDDIYNAEYIKEILADTSINILFVKYGKEAVQLSLIRQIDIVLMDIGLPDISGYEAIIQIKQHKPDLRIIVQTAYAASEDKKKAMDSGCVGYISKPLKKSLLLSIINKHLY